MGLSSDSQRSEFSFQSRRRSWEFLKQNQDKIHNVLIVGGGIVGAGTLRQLLYSGVKDLALVEKNDFASGTSGASSKLIHAGIRYLEQSWIHLKSFRFKEAILNFIFVVKASNERKILGRMAPGLVVPKNIFLILAKGDDRCIFSVLLGVWFYYCIQLLQGQFFSPPQFYFLKATIKKRFPDLNSEEVKSVFGFWDSETDDARLVIENLQSSNDQGALIFNYVELLKTESNEDVITATLKDHETGEIVTFKTKLLINAAGPWVDEVRSKESGAIRDTLLVDRVAGGHIDVYPSFTNESFYITAADGRLVFVLRREEDGLAYTRMGTTERPLKAGESIDEIKPTIEEINYLKNLVRRYFPKATLDHADLLHLDEGVRPLVHQDKNNPTQKSREHQIYIEDRMVHVVGVKLTDFRRAAHDIVQVLDWEKLGISISKLEAVRRPLRSSDATRMYLEKSLGEAVHQTMILHWSDYVERRRGRWLRWMEKVQPERWDAELHELGQKIGWTPEQIEVEKSKVSKI